MIVVMVLWVYKSLDNRLPMSKRKAPYDHEDLVQKMKKLRTHRGAQKRSRDETHARTNKRACLALDDAGEDDVRAHRHALHQDLTQALRPRKQIVDLQEQLRQAEEKLSSYRQYLVDIQLRFFHVSNQLRTSQQSNAELRDQVRALSASQQQAQLRWLRCGSHVHFLKNTAIPAL